MKRLIGIAAMMMFAWSVMAQNGPTLSEDVSRMMSEHAGRKVLSPDHDGRLCAFVRLRNAEGERLLSEQHCEVVARLGDILIVNIPLGALPTLAASQAVDRIETHLGGRRMNDVSQEWLHTAPLHQGSAPFVQAYDGQGVLVGIVDVGLDVSHPTFLSADGSHSRVVRFLDQYAPDDETLGDATSLGREYSTPDDIAAKQHSADVSQTHGTHCLGTAVGSGFGSPYRGVAYGADVFAVASQGVPGSLCSANEVALMKHIFDYADEHQQPCVITYSSGYDYRDTDNELFQEAMGLLTGPGRIIVAAAGNKNYHLTYVEKRADQPHAGTTLQLSSEQGRVYLRSADSFRLKCVISQLNDGSYEKGDSLVIASGDFPDGSAALGPFVLMTSREGAFYTLDVQSASAESDRLMLLIEDIDGEHAHVEMYPSFNYYFIADRTHDGRFDSAEHSHNINMPACLPNIVAIGALNGRDSYQNMSGEEMTGYSGKTPVGTITYFSSVGPTFDGRTKPDAVAPGLNVISSGNSFSTTDRSRTYVSTVAYNGREYPWMALSGTSMACPAAAGVVALWLQANPSLTPDEVKATFAATCTHPVADLSYPNNTYGYGLIDAYAGMLHVLGIDDAVPGISIRQPAGVRIRPDDAAVSLQFGVAPRHPFTVSVYRVDGQCVATRQFDAGALDYRLPLSTPRGLYVVDVRSDERGVTGSELLRF